MGLAYGFKLIGVLDLRNVIALNWGMFSASLAANTNPGRPQSFQGPKETGISEDYQTVHVLPPYSPTAFWQVYPQTVLVSSERFQLMGVALSV